MGKRKEKEQVVKVRRARIGEDPKDRGQGPRTDTRAYVRVATPRDGEKLRGMFSRASSETIRLRFHLPYPVVPERTLALMVDVDHPDKESLVAVVGDGIVGHAMYARLGDVREAEMAIIVEDGWQWRGVGRLLLSELAQKARLLGIETFIGDVLGENRRMLGLTTMFAGTRRTIEDGVYRVRMPLGEPDTTTPAARTLHRAA